jgi:hypothetical protein
MRLRNALLIDLGKAFGNVAIELIWKEMENIGLSPVLIKATENLYKKTTRIKIGSKLMEEFKATKGLRQGCCLSPTLLKMYLDAALQGCQGNCTNMGCRWDTTYRTPCISQMTN